MPSSFGFKFDNSYANQLAGFYVAQNPSPAPAPRLVYFNTDLAAELGLESERLQSEAGDAIFSGNQVPPGASPLAQAYAGHQFGGFSAQLGDGRALLIGELVTPQHGRLDWAMKGSGPTPFSRGGDGKAALGPVLREVIMSEAMHALGVPTTRALAAAVTGEFIFRDDAVPGAVLSRLASSHIRVGTFQFFAARGEWDKVRQLADYAIARHYPEVADADQPYLALFSQVCQRQAQLMARWMTLGFIHGVMNTDNMTISGETIDYGPCAMMDAYRPGTVYSSIDRQGRYAFANQPGIARWNLARFAETLLPLLGEDEDVAVQKVSDVLNAFIGHYEGHWLALMRSKLGLRTEQPHDLALVKDLLLAMETQQADYTQVMRALATACVAPQSAVVTSLFDQPQAYLLWSTRWRQRWAMDSDLNVPAKVDAANRIAGMNWVNPVYIPRNHKVEEALSAAMLHNDFQPFNTLLRLVSHPFTEQDNRSDFANGPAKGLMDRYQTFCGT